MQVIIFIDYDNLQALQKSRGLLDVATSALMAYPLSTKDLRGRCEVRVYGGWYEGSGLTPNAQELSAAMQIEFPKILRVFTQNGNLCSLAALQV